MDKILVVDDEKEIADLEAFYLESENFDVTVCYSSKEALEQIKTPKRSTLSVLNSIMPSFFKIF